MPITIHLPNLLARLADGRQTVNANGATLGDAVSEVTARYPKLRQHLCDPSGNPFPFVRFYVNDEDSRYVGGFRAAVRDGDEIAVIPAVAGG
jgi:molybdopterin synthase sulfur carrier subunit